MSADSESRRAFESYVDSENDRLNEFRQAVARRGGPSSAELDLSRESLATLGRWLLTPPPPGEEDRRPAHWVVVVPDGHPRRPTIWMIDGIATYLAAALRRMHPGLRWRLNEDRRDPEYLHPQLGSFGGAWLWAFQPVNALLDRARASNPPDPDWLVRIFDQWSAHGPAEGASDLGGDEDVRDLLDVEVGPISGDPDWNAEIWITEAAEPILGQELFEQLEGKLAAISGIERLGWEDREHFLLKVSRGTDLASIQDSVRDILRASYRASKE